MGSVAFLDTCKFVGPPSKAQNHLIWALDSVGRQMSLDLIVTCAEEGHRPDDPHTKKKAFDVRVKDFAPAIILTLYRTLCQQLDRNLWTVLYEVPALPNDALLQQIAYVNPEASGPHLHLQVKRGLDYTDG